MILGYIRALGVSFEVEFDGDIESGVDRVDPDVGGGGGNPPRRKTDQNRRPGAF